MAPIICLQEMIGVRRDRQTKTTVQVNIAGRDTNCLLDTGSQVTSVLQSFYEEHLADLTSQMIYLKWRLLVVSLSPNYDILSLPSPFLKSLYALILKFTLWPWLFPTSALQAMSRHS